MSISQLGSKHGQGSMTVTYIQHVLSGGKFGAFLRLLFMWRGSVYKATGVNLIIFISLYTLISLLYRYLLSQEEQYKLGMSCYI